MGGRREGAREVRKKEAYGREARKEACVQNIIRLHAQTVVKSKVQCVNGVLSPHLKFMGS